MKTCCCSLAGTAACLRCANNSGDFNNFTKPYSISEPSKNYGWICPICGRVYSEIVIECSHCNKECEKNEENRSKDT